MRNLALIVAAGRGHRVGGPMPKQYRSLAGRPVLSHTIAAFAGLEKIDAVRAVIHPDDDELYREAIRALDDGLESKVLAPTNGGKTRQDSVRRGLESLAQNAPYAVLIHDGARPLVSKKIIIQTLDLLTENVGAIAALPLNDSLKCANEEGKHITRDVARDGFWRAQTPQTFRFPEILAAHRAAKLHNATDDAAVAEQNGLRIALVMGEEENIKITTESDMARAEQLLNHRSPTTGSTWRVKVGMGYDVHRFIEGGNILTICGVHVPFEKGIASHSDGDVALHAVVDAILGALGEGDIGVHFPPTNEQWRGASSDIFIGHALQLLTMRGGKLDHIDVTVICERPKLHNHRAAMQNKLASLLCLPEDAVSLKATTTEKLGFTGREEGIAAQALATLRIPVPVEQKSQNEYV